MLKKGKKIAVTALAAAFFSISISSLAEEIESRKLSILETSGENVFVVKANDRKIKAAKGMGLGPGNEVSTGKFSKIYIEADKDKVIRLDELTDVEISKASAKSLKLTLKNGDLFFNVDKPLSADEDMTFEAAHTSMSIRGTSGIFSFNPLKMEFYLVEGNVSWDLGDGTVVELKAGEAIELERDWGDQPMGPGAEVVYTLKSQAPFDWTDLNEEGLAALMENKALLDLTSIGLDTEEEFLQAEKQVEEYHKEQKVLEDQYKRRYDRDYDRDYDPPISKPPVTNATGSDAEKPELPEEPETPESLIPEGKTEGVDGDILFDTAGNSTWVDYKVGINGFMNTITNEFEWNNTWLDENGYLTEVLVETE